MTERAVGGTRFVARRAPSHDWRWWVVRCDPDGSEWLLSVVESKRDALGYVRDLVSGGLTRGGEWMGDHQISGPTQLDVFSAAAS